jgi:hypothetical protein
MKTHISKPMIAGIINVDYSKATLCIEYKWFKEPNQLNLRLVSTSWKIKDKKERLLHQSDYVKGFVRKAILTRLNKEADIPEKANVVWWTST